jgi:hypothetical protein
MFIACVHVSTQCEEVVMYNRNTTMCSMSNTRVNAENPPIRSKKHMANVRKVSYARTFPKVTAQVDVPENLYEEPRDLQDDDMNHRHSSPAAVPEVSETSKHGFPSDMITKATSIQLTPNKMAAKDRRNSKFQATPGDSIVSTTSLIMAGSPYLESMFLDGNRSLEDLFIRSREYPFDNLVFEGGGSKGMAYVGALQVRIV